MSRAAEHFEARLESRMDEIYADDKTLGQYAIRFVQQDESVIGKVRSNGTGGYVYLNQSVSDLFEAWLDDTVRTEVASAIDADRFDYQTRDAA